MSNSQQDHEDQQEEDADEHEQLSEVNFLESIFFRNFKFSEISSLSKDTRKLEKSLPGTSTSTICSICSSI